MNSQKVIKYRFPSFRRKPESSIFNQLQSTWTPVFTGVTTFYEFINFICLGFSAGGEDYRSVSKSLKEVTAGYCNHTLQYSLFHIPHLIL